MVHEGSDLEGEKWLLLVRLYPDDSHPPALIGFVGSVYTVMM
jgi:hypothetical protein